MPLSPAVAVPFQLLRGAALNAVIIAEAVVRDQHLK